MSDLLPYNATEFERLLDDAVADALRGVPIPVRDAWSPDNCPAAALPWLAWAFSVDDWSEAWDDEVRRAIIRSSTAVHRSKGTSAAVKEVLGSLGFGIELLEWHRKQVIGAPYTYDLYIRVRERGFDLDGLEGAIAAVDKVKSLRSHLNTVLIEVNSGAGVWVGAVAHVGSEVVVGANEWRERVVDAHSADGVPEGWFVARTLGADLLVIAPEPAGLIDGAAFMNASADWHPQPFGPIGMIDGAALMTVTTDWHPHPFAPAGMIDGAVLIDAT